METNSQTATMKAEHAPSFSDQSCAQGGLMGSTHAHASRYAAALVIYQSVSSMKSGVETGMDRHEAV